MKTLHAPRSPSLADILGSAIPGLRKIEDTDLTNLQTLLNRWTWRDPYAGSAAYYGLTGRNGLWTVARDGGFMMLAEHPHRPGKLLLFPPAGDWPGVLGAVLRALPSLPGGYQFARLPAGMSAQMGRFSGWTAPHAAATTTGEDCLDWRYPVHVLDSRAVARHEGSAFRDFRKNVRRVPADRITAEPFRANMHASVVEAIAHAWAGEKGHANGKAVATVQEPYARLLNLMACLPLSGRLYRLDGEPVGFTIWEETDPKRGIANSLADLTTRQVRGLSEFIYADVCAVLADRGFSSVCIGGSEDAGLDAFKRKMQPIDSVPLTSLHYRHDLNPRYAYSPSAIPA